MRVTLLIHPPRSREVGTTVFYRAYLATPQRTVWRDFHGKGAKKRATDFVTRWWMKMVSRHKTASVRIKRITSDIAWMYQ